MQTHTLVFDLSNLTYLGAYYLGRGIENHPDAPERIQQSVTKVMREFYKWFQPERVIFACDSATYWRRDLFPDYKGHRREHLLKQQVKAAITGFKATNAKLCIEVENCEADDVIYAVSQFTDNTVSIVSSDQDFIQLMSERVKVFEPRYKQFRALPKKPEYELFVKCMRGDVSDNIPSAYPYIRTRRLQAAYHQPKLMTEIMDTQLEDGSTVSENYERNCQLIDLSRIPEHYQAQLKAAVL